MNAIYLPLSKIPPFWEAAQEEIGGDKVLKNTGGICALDIFCEAPFVLRHLA